jgi:hypothetical protein
MNEQHDFHEAVIEHCASMGIQVTRAQLDRWRRAGALPAALGDPATIESGPLPTARQACALTGELERERHLPTAVFAIWLKGYRVELPAVRAFLVNRARLHDGFVSEVRAAGFGGAVLPEGALTQVERMAGVRRRDAVLLADARARLGSRERFETLLRVLLDALAGRYVSTPSPSASVRARESEGLLFESALGLSHAREPLDGFVFLRDDPEALLHQLPGLLSGEWSRSVAEASDAELLAARDALTDMVEVVRGVAEAFAPMLEDDHFGFGALGTLVDEAMSSDLALVVAGLLAARHDRALMAGIDELRAALPMVRALRAQAAEVMRLQADPIRAALFTPAKLRAAFVASIGAAD